MFGFGRDKTQMVGEPEALPGRIAAIPTAKTHFITGAPLTDKVPEGQEAAMFGMGCFWGVERLFWQIPGVELTMVGYAGGYTPNATYDEVCTGMTGHNEVVRLHFDPTRLSYDALLAAFWEGHNPTQGMRQGNDRGTQYRSGIYVFSDAQMAAAKASKEAYQEALGARGLGQITTEILMAPDFYFAEEYHQQYLAKNPAGYCGLGGTGVSCPVGLGAR
ncbi:MAG: peptide-methionine (S)-S-oxide reductase MsrA [Vannielia sp.]|uniref:peptide-methionine (S)-S-oxide reductase MsrA n=1 Tax=Rhodobacterales TaxID=204455 RepID=UPI002095DBD1|nr:peptide-methionine (S)-S-oxide reductase MsrA [Oceanicola sp. 502str15]MCO6382808.1 peptide-methionine (S)-S-oxide reductase MsrA [Oceanicola sp. 502str15]